jgi:hypothetical protein
MTFIICQTCGAEWHLAENFDVEMFYFRSSTGELVKPTSAAHIADAELDMISCPKCPLPLDYSMGAPDPNTGLQPGRAPDRGERSPGPGDSDAVHPPEED